MSLNTELSPSLPDEPSGVSTVKTKLTINGEAVELIHDVRSTLLDCLRERLQLTGTKKGCNEGACGACTVIVDGKTENSCLTLMASCEGQSIETIEGVADPDGVVARIRKAFVEQDAMQCGYCTSGQILSAVTCFRKGHAGSEAEIAEWMSGNICRCSAYPQIVAAVQHVAKGK